MNTLETQWPQLNYAAMKDTLQTVQLMAQIVGKIRLRNMPWLNHSWHVTFYVSAIGLTTGSIPYSNGVFQIELDLLNHELVITTSKGQKQIIVLQPCTIAGFYREITEKLQSLKINAAIYAVPNEIEPAIPFAQDEQHRHYEREQIHAYWQALVKVHNVMLNFRARFTGKCSPIHLFWGAFDLAVTRFSGRTAPLHPGGAPNMPLRIMQEAYSHEVSSCGFWPGSDDAPGAAFYSYCYPTPADFGRQQVQPAGAFYSAEMGEFFLSYDVVRNADDPASVLMQFLQSTYEAAAQTGHWDQNKLECDFSSFEKN